MVTIHVDDLYICKSMFVIEDMLVDKGFKIFDSTQESGTYRRGGLAILCQWAGIGLCKLEISGILDNVGQGEEFLNFILEMSKGDDNEEG